MPKTPTKLTPEEIQNALQTAPGWTHEEDAIVRSFEFQDFKEAFAFLTRVALVTEEANHHAEIWNVWNRVTLKFSTHDAGGLTSKDFEAARIIGAFVS